MGGLNSKALDKVLVQTLTDRRSRFSQLDILMWQEILLPYVVGPSFCRQTHRYRQFKTIDVEEPYCLGWTGQLLIPQKDSCLIFRHKSGRISRSPEEYKNRFHETLRYRFNKKYHVRVLDEYVIFRWLKTKHLSEGEYEVNWLGKSKKIVSGCYRYRGGYFLLGFQAYDLNLNPLARLDLWSLPAGRIFHNEYPNILPENLREKIVRPCRFWAGDWYNKIMVTQEGNILVVDTKIMNPDRLIAFGGKIINPDITLVRLYSRTGQLILSRKHGWELLSMPIDGHLYFKEGNTIWVARM